MADYAEEIAKRLADRRARRRYWPEGEPDSRRERDRGKRRGKSDPSEMKASYDPKFKGKPKAEPEKLESISEFVKKERTRRLERALKTMEERRVVPKDVPLKKWLSQPGNLDRALKRGMVRMIARHANPKSKDTDDVVTVGGRRYAKTDLYKAPLREKASEIVLKTKYGSEMWWDRNKKAIFVASVSLVAGFMIYSAWKNAQLEKGLAKQRTRRRGPATHAGLLAMPAHHWHRPRYFSGPRSPFFYGRVPHRFGHWRAPWGGWNPWYFAGAHGGGGGGAGHGGGGGAGHGGGGGAGRGGGGAMQSLHGQSGGGVTPSLHGQGGGGVTSHHGYGREGWGGGGWGGYGGWGGWGGWGDWNPWYLDDTSFWGDPYDAFNPEASWW